MFSPLSTSQVLSSATPSNREDGLRRLRESGVRVVKGVRVKRVNEDGAVVVAGREVRFAVRNGLRDCFRALIAGVGLSMLRLLDSRSYLP